MVHGGALRGPWSGQDWPERCERWVKKATFSREESQAQAHKQLGEIMTEEQIVDGGDLMEGELHSNSYQALLMTWIVYILFEQEHCAVGLKENNLSLAPARKADSEIAQKTGQDLNDRRWVHPESVAEYMIPVGPSLWLQIENTGLEVSQSVRCTVNRRVMALRRRCCHEFGSAEAFCLRIHLERCQSSTKQLSLNWDRTSHIDSSSSITQ